MRRDSRCRRNLHGDFRLRNTDQLIFGFARNAEKPQEIIGFSCNSKRDTALRPTEYYAFRARGYASTDAAAIVAR